MNDTDGKFIESQAYQSIFTWNFGKYTRVIQHPCKFLPEILANDGITAYISFMSVFAKVFLMSMLENFPQSSPLI